jgi:hypothetical protein
MFRSETSITPMLSHVEDQVIDVTLVRLARGQARVRRMLLDSTVSLSSCSYPAYYLPSSYR